MHVISDHALMDIDFITEAQVFKGNDISYHDTKYGYRDRTPKNQAAIGCTQASKTHESAQNNAFPAL
jgi:hypothetical protein